MSDELAIEVKHLSKIYKIFDKPVNRIKEALHPFHKRYSRDFYALDDVSFTVKKGETVGFIGKNGAGKSTLLKILTGVLTPSSGTVTVNGRVASLLELGAGFNPEMTGIENIYLNGTVMGYSKKEMDGKLEDIVAFADIGDFINQPVKMYSSGMFARLAFAVNAYVDPDILIVDEALSVGDIFFQNKCFKRMDDLRNRGTTILLVSHDISSMRLLCDKCIWLEHGTVYMSGAAKDVCECYFTAQIKENASADEFVTQNINEAVIKPQTIDSVLELPSLPANCNGVFNDNVIIKSVFVENANGNIVSVLKNDEIYSIKMAVEFHVDMDNVIFGILLETVKGINVLGFNTFICPDNDDGKNEKTVRVKKGNIYLVGFKFKLPKIQSGTYLLTPAVAQGTQKTHTQLTWLENIIAVKIVNCGYDISLINLDANMNIQAYSDIKVADIE